MNVLMISLDFTLALDEAKVSGDSRNRHIAYGNRLSNLIIVVMGGKAKNLKSQRLSDKVAVYPVLYRNPASYVWEGYKVCRKICRENNIDVITTQDPFLTGLIGYFLKKRLGLPLEMQLHGDFFDNQHWLRENRLNPYFNMLGKWLIRRADGVRVVGSGIKRKLLDYGLPDEKIWIIPAPVFLNKFTHSSIDEAGDIRRKYHLDNGKVVLFVGTFTRAKNIANLLRAARIVVQSHADTRFLLCGDGKERSSLESLARELGISDNLVFAGEIPYDDLPRYYQACDLFVLPSDHESFGLVLLEAGVAGKPVVATDVTGPRDIVLDNNTGFLVPPRDSQALAAKIIRLIESPALAKEMGENARKHILASFDPEAAIRRIVDMWTVLVKLAAGDIQKL